MKSGLIPRVYTTGEVLDELNIPKHKLDYLFDSRQILKQDITWRYGKRVYSQELLERIRKLVK